MRTSSLVTLALGAATCVFAGCAHRGGSSSALQAVRPAFETEPVLTDGDAADDPAIWIHPTDPSRSLILGTDKQRGIIAYDLSGRVAHEAPGRINNVDVVQGFAVSGGSVDLALGTERQG
ncbi:MAG: phytase, partial [Phycisphaerales bacterium]